MILVIASKNKGKQREIKNILKPLEFELQPLSYYPNAPEVEETGSGRRDAKTDASAGDTSKNSATNPGRTGKPEDRNRNSS